MKNWDITIAQLGSVKSSVDELPCQKSVDSMHCSSNIETRN